VCDFFMALMKSVALIESHRTFVVEEDERVHPCPYASRPFSPEIQRDRNNCHGYFSSLFSKSSFRLVSLSLSVACFNVSWSVSLFVFSFSSSFSFQM